jgi:acyl carrier protein
MTYSHLLLRTGDGRVRGMGDSLETRIRSIVAERLGVELTEITPEATILDDLGADSLDVVELVMALEEEFDIEVPDEHVEQMRTIGDMERYVTERAA